MTDIQQRHIEQLRSENSRLVRDVNGLHKRIKSAGRRVWIAEVFCVLSIGLAAAGAGLWWKGAAERSSMSESIMVLSDNYDVMARNYDTQQRTAETLATLYPLTVYGMNYALSSEQDKAGTVTWMLNKSQQRLQACYAENKTLRRDNGDLLKQRDRAAESASQARASTFTGNVDTGE